MKVQRRFQREAALQAGMSKAFEYVEREVASRPRKALTDDNIGREVFVVDGRVFWNYAAAYSSSRQIYSNDGSIRRCRYVGEGSYEELENLGSASRFNRLRPAALLPKEYEERDGKS